MGSDDVERRFRRRVKSERRLASMSQSELANAMRERGLSVHATTIAKIEDDTSGKPRAIKFEEAVAIAEILKFSLDSVLTPIPHHEDYEYRVARFIGGFGVVGEELYRVVRVLEEAYSGADVDELTATLLADVPDPDDESAEELIRKLMAGLDVYNAFPKLLLSLQSILREAPEAITNGDSKEFISRYVLPLYEVKVRSPFEDRNAQ